MSRYRVSKDAAADLNAAVRWYDDQREGLGVELAGEFMERVGRALELPGAGVLVGVTSRGAEVRRHRFKRFARYSILMATIDGMPTVLALVHSSRLPGFWRNRLK